MQVKSDFILAHCLAMASAANAGLTEVADMARVRALRTTPTLSISRVSRIQPFYDKGVETAWFDGLRRAGLPE